MSIFGSLFNWGSKPSTPTQTPATPVPMTGLASAINSAQPVSSSDRITQVAQGVAKFTAGFEGERLTPYQDSAGVWTIGIGTTMLSPSQPVTAHTPSITHEQALDFLARDMRSAIQTVENNVKVPLTLEEEEALADFVYNVGSGNFAKSTLLKKLNSGDYDGAAAQFEVWNLAGGKVLAGLVRRRAAEKSLFQKNS